MTVSFFVPGLPQPQGSARAWLNRKTGRPIVTSDNKALRPWRLDVKTIALEAWASRSVLSCPVSLILDFRFPRPKGHYGVRGLRPAAPAAMTVRPDWDKLARAIGDSLKDAGVYRDDAQVVHAVVSKGYGEKPGVTVTVDWQDLAARAA